MNTVDINIKNQNKEGFTLIELSIVMVIIGLIIGGILVGQELIHSAQNRAIITQINQYNSAVTTFQSKYNGLPGDFRFATDFLANNSPVNGNGDGLIGSAGSSASLVGTAGGVTIAGGSVVGQEYSQFWGQLSGASLIEDSITPVAYTVDQNVGYNFPYIKSSRNVGIFMYGNVADRINYYHLGAVSLAAAGYILTTVNSFSPVDAMNIDSKMDDGLPVSGIVVARNVGGVDVYPTFTGNTALTANLAGCVFGDHTYTIKGYNTALSIGNIQCSLRIALKN
jgi:prepilin-type N-terminal cleavage/methylation domain-containing protein